MPDPINLSFVFGMKPEDAIRYFDSKKYKRSWDWREFREADHAKYFTVAKVASLDVLTSIREELRSSLNDGVPLSEIKKNLKPILQKLGWFGRVDQSSGEVVYSPRRLETIYRANMQSAYMAGRYKAFKDNADERPYWQYVAVLDSRTRPSHMALNGRVFRHDDPIWKNIWPPNDWGCRCRVRALTARQVASRGLTVNDSEKYTTHWTSEDRDGNQFSRTSIKLPGMQHEFVTGAGWDGNQAMLAGDNMTALAFRKAATANPFDAAAAIGMILTNPIVFYERENKYQVWLKDIDPTRTTKAKMAVGALPLELAYNLAYEYEISAPAVIEVIDERYVHARRATPPRTTPFTLEQWLALPSMLLHTPLVLLDLATPSKDNQKSLLFLTPSILFPQAADKIVVTLNYKWKGALSPEEERVRQFINSVTTAYTTRDVYGLWNNEKYPVVYGSWGDFWRMMPK